MKHAQVNEKFIQIFINEPQGKRPSGRPTHTEEDTKMELGEIRCEGFTGFSC
jgi:hypothetical protein